MNDEYIVVMDLHTTGKFAFHDRITGISLKSANCERIFTGTNEAEIINDSIRFIEEKGFRRLIGFNIFNFDLPFLKIRCLKHNICFGHLDIEFLDLRAVLADGRERVKGKLADYRKLLDMTEEYPKVGINLSWDSATFSKYENVLLDDVRTTWQLYERSMEIGLI